MLHWNCYATSDDVLIQMFGKSFGMYTEKEIIQKHQCKRSMANAITTAAKKNYQRKVRSVALYSFCYRSWKCIFALNMWWTRWLFCAVQNHLITAKFWIDFMWQHVSFSCKFMLSNSTILPITKLHANWERESEEKT